MLFAVDIGNTNIVLAINDGKSWIQLWRIHTDVKKTSDEYFIDVKNIISSMEKVKCRIDRAIISSVVPSLTLVFRKVCYNLFNVDAVVVDHKTDSGIDQTSIPEELGSDILSNLVAGHSLFPNDYATVVDFGTALTVSTVSPEARVMGVAIAPGLVTSVNALASNTAQLPFIELKEPETVLGQNSIQSIRAGIMFGFAGLVDSLISRIEKEIGTSVKVIVTGGLSNTIKGLLGRVDYSDKNHTLNGLKIISDRNFKS